MNPRCDTLLDEIKKKGKLSEDDLLQLCEEYDLFPNEVDWITDRALECHCLALSDYRTPKSSFNRDMEPSLLQLPDWMVDIPDKYFSNRQDLCHIILAKGIKSVGNYVFYRCGNLQSITFPATIERVGYGNFTYCKQLREIIFLGDLPAGRENINQILCNLTEDAYLQRIVIYGNLDNLPSPLSLFGGYNLNNSLKIILLSIPLPECYQFWGQRLFLCIEGFVYGQKNGFAFNTVVEQRNKEYIAKYSKQIFYYAVIKGSSLLLQYLYENNLIPSPLYSQTVDSIYPMKLRNEIKQKVLVRDNYNSVYSNTKRKISENWNYTCEPNHTVTITFFRGHNIDYVCVPEKIGEFPVEKISRGAFSINPYPFRLKNEDKILRSWIRYIELPSTVKYIENGAFYGVDNVTIKIPPSVCFIDKDALEFSGNVTIISPKGSYAMNYAVEHHIKWKDAESRDISFTIVGAYTKMLQSGMKITIIKEPDNSYDPFAIRVELDDIGCVGHIANRSRTVKRGSVSASALYDVIGDNASATILEAYPQYAIAILNEAKDNCDEQSL